MATTSFDGFPGVAPQPLPHVSGAVTALTRTLLLASVCYLALLSFLNARGIHMSTPMLGLAEAAIYSLCLLVQIKRLPLSTVALGCLVSAWIVFTWLIRQSPDVKSLRDLIIPVLFLGLGRYLADVGFADRTLKLIVGVLVAVALFEVFFLDLYATLFNTFSFYVNVGGINERAAMFQGQMLTLNGYRPEGIGRTILPAVFGPHRASSLLMEPVSLGNFAVIVLAWVLSQSWADIRRSRALLIGVIVIITLCDSRFGLMMSGALITYRLLPPAKTLAPLPPLIILGLSLAIAAFMPSDGDNLLGRISRSGVELLRFDWALLLGLGDLPNFGDMGFAYVLSRFGAPLVVVLYVTIFLIPMADTRGERFRASIVLYLAASLAISGTSIFALKTAGIMWFLFGVLSATRAGDATEARPRAFSPQGAPRSSRPAPFKGTRA